MKTPTKKTYHLWTKDELKQLVRLWDDKTTDELAEEFGVQKHSIYYIAKEFRKHGYKLPKKHHVGKTGSLIQEVIKELK